MRDYISIKNRIERMRMADFAEHVSKLADTNSLAEVCETFPFYKDTGEGKKAELLSKAKTAMKKNEVFQ